MRNKTSRAALIGIDIDPVSVKGTSVRETVIHVGSVVGGKFVVNRAARSRCRSGGSTISMGILRGGIQHRRAITFSLEYQIGVVGVCCLANIAASHRPAGRI